MHSDKLHILFYLCLLSFSLSFLSPPPLSHRFPITILSPSLSSSLHSHIPPPLPSPPLSPVFASSHFTCWCLSFCFRVFSQVDWPLNIIITDSCMNKYNRLFSFLLQLKHMVWSLREVWFHLKRTGERVEAFDSGSSWSPPRPLRRKSWFFLLCYIIYKIFIGRNTASPLCFIYTKHISCQWDCCKIVCFSGSDTIDQWTPVYRTQTEISSSGKKY